MKKSLKKQIEKAGYCAESALLWQVGDIETYAENQGIDISDLTESEKFDILCEIIKVGSDLIMNIINDLISDNLLDVLEDYRIEKRTKQ